LAPLRTLSVVSNEPVAVRHIRVVGHEAAGFDEFRAAVPRW
jgi:hypothetical protein